MNYKVGDKVKIIKNNSGILYYDKYIGEITTIVKIEYDRYVLNLQSESDSGYNSCWEPSEFILWNRKDKLKRIMS